MTRAHQLFTAVPKKHNCAQAVMDGCGGTPEQVAEMAEIKAEFARRAGALTCRDLKTVAHTPCPICVETAAQLAETYS